MPSKIFQNLTVWNCPIHGGFSNLNRCAWPDCPNGVAESSVEASVPGFNEVKTFHRVSWRGRDGDTFHDWQTGEMPSWFGISRPYSYFENNMIKNASLDQMFHYTSVEGALAILQSGCLRFTDYAYLNDTREVTYGLDAMRSALDSDAHTVDSQALKNLKIHINDGDPFSSYNIYTASFSSDSDSLSQFRLYGPVALGFEANTIGFGYPIGDIHLGHVVYDVEKQDQLIEVLFDLIKQSEEKDAAMIESDETKKITTNYLISRLLQILALFKHSTFSDEKEVRLLYSEPHEIMDQIGDKPAQRQFRASNGLIVPFTDTFNTTRIFSSDEKKKSSGKLPLKSVVIGPTAQAKVVANGMRDLLKFMGYHDVEVLLSEAPLRS